MQISDSPARPVSIPGMQCVRATEVTAPPLWAVLERRLIDLMNDSARTYVRKYTERGGGSLLAEDFDDIYEQFYNYGLFYALGGDDDILDLHLQQWNATNRIHDVSFDHRPVHNNHTKKFAPSQYREFWSKDSLAEWHHLSEGNMPFYDMGLCDPTISENVRRAKRFAAMFIGEDPEAPNYDKNHRVLRSPFHSSQGPVLEGDAWLANLHLLGGPTLGGPGRYYGVRATLYPKIENLEVRWFENPVRKQQVVDLFNDLIMRRDTPNSLGATALVTNAYLYTGDDKYKQWVLDYTEAWMDRTKKNGGICPDNVGLTGTIGEGREGVWWGGLYGWNHYHGYSLLFHGISVAAQCAHLLTGDAGYEDFMRS